MCVFVCLTVGTLLSATLHCTDTPPPDTHLYTVVCLLSQSPSGVHTCLLTIHTTRK